VELVLATSNQGKRREIEAIAAPMGVSVRLAAELGFSQEVEETGDTFRENAALKALAVAAALGRPALADDSGLVVDALGGAPGVKSARYAGEKAGDRANYQKLLAALQGVPMERRGAAFVCVMCLAAPGGATLFAAGRLNGAIALAPAGEGGFGYDPVFLLPELGLTVAQLPAGEKNRISHRAAALAKLSQGMGPFLKGLP